MWFVKQEFKFLSCTWTLDVESFNRKVKLKTFFHNKNEQKQQTELTSKEPSIKSKTSWNQLEPSKKNHHTAEMFIEAVNKFVLERFSDKKTLPKNNFTGTDKIAIEHFSKRNGLVLRMQTKAEQLLF